MGELCVDNRYDSPGTTVSNPEALHYCVGFNGQGVVECPTEGEHRVGLLTFRIARSAFGDKNWFILC